MTGKSTFMDLRKDEREIRKTLIMEAAMTLFEKKSFHEIGMRDIAKEAGVSAATIYRYFPGRDDLFIDALIQDVNNMENLVTEKHKERLLQNEKISIEDFAVQVVDYLIDNEATFQMMCHFMIRGGINDRVKNKFDAVQVYFMKMFDAVMKEVGVSEHDNHFAQAFFASLTGVVMTFRNYPNRTKEEKRKHMHTLALLIMQDGLSIETPQTKGV